MAETAEYATPEAPMPEKGSVCARYDQLATRRSTFLNRAREAAVLTIPSLIPPAGSNFEFPTPYQSLGARAVNNLSAKLLLAQFPAEAAFFRLEPSKPAVQEAEQAAGGKEVLAEIENQLRQIEDQVQLVMENAGQRPTLFTTLRHLVVGGNGLLHVLPDNRLEFFPLAQYVVRRDLQGNELEIITKQCLAWNSLPAEVRDAITKDAQAKKPDSGDVDLYTRIWLDEQGRMWKVVQECCGLAIESTRGSYPKGKLPWIVLRWTEVPGEDYGRGHVEEYICDLYALEGLSKAIVEGSLGSAKLLFLVNPAGTTSCQKLAEADNLDFVEGEEKDIGTLKADKLGDFQVARSAAEGIESRLSQAFLLASSVQRQAERVTAEEISYLAAELESSLGGLYSLLSKELQRPLVTAILRNLERTKQIPVLKPGTVDLAIITGLDALGRTNDQRSLIQLLTTLRESLGDQFVQEWINGETAGKRLAVASRIDPDGLFRSADEVAQGRQAQQYQALREKLGPAAIKAASDQVASAPPQPQANGT